MMMAHYIWEEITRIHKLMFILGPSPEFWMEEQSINKSSTNSNYLVAMPHPPKLLVEVDRPLKNLSFSSCFETVAADGGRQKSLEDLLAVVTKLMLAP